MRRITDKSRCAWEWHNFNIEHWYHWNQFRFYWVRIKNRSCLSCNTTHDPSETLIYFFDKNLFLYNPPIAKLYFSILLMLPALRYGNYKPCRFKYNWRSTLIISQLLFAYCRDAAMTQVRASSLYIMYDLHVTRDLVFFYHNLNLPLAN